MTWADHRRAELVRLRWTLRHHFRDLADADAEQARNGAPPGEPLRAEIARAKAAVADLGWLVGEQLRAMEPPRPYRPAVSPVRGAGMNAKLRPDFAVRGITSNPGRTDPARTNPGGSHSAGSHPGGPGAAGPHPEGSRRR